MQDKEIFIRLRFSHLSEFVYRSLSLIIIIIIITSLTSQCIYLSIVALLIKEITNQAIYQQIK